MNKSCEEHWDPLITHYVLGDLEEEKEVSVLNHIQTCNRCREKNKNRKKIKEKLSSWSSPLPSSNRREEVLARMKSEHREKQKKESTGTLSQIAAVFILFVMTGTIIASLLSGFYFSTPATAANPVQLQISNIEGTNLILRSENGRRIQPKKGKILSRGDTIWTGDRTTITLETTSGDTISLDQNTTMRIGTRLKESGKTHLYLQKGSVETDIRKGRGGGRLLFLTPSGQVEADDASFQLTVR